MRALLRRSSDDKEALRSKPVKSAGDRLYTKPAKSAAESAQNGTWAKGRVKKWLSEKGFGFVEVEGDSTDVFVHADKFETITGVAGSTVYVKIERDASRGSDKYRVKLTKPEAEVLAEIA